MNWRGGPDKNIEIDLLQENRNSEMKKLIKAMGANKTEVAISRASNASGGVTKIVEAYEGQVKMHNKSSVHSHKSSTEDEKLVSKDLRDLRPFRIEDGRMFETFPGISHEPLQGLDHKKFEEWTDRHRNNILMHYPLEPEEQIPE